MGIKGSNAIFWKTIPIAFDLAISTLQTMILPTSNDGGSPPYTIAIDANLID